MQIVAVALEDFVLLDEHLHKEVSARTAVGAGLALTLDANALTVVDARRNIDFQRLGLTVAAASLAVRTRIGNDFTRSVAVRTGLLHLQESAVDVDHAATAAMRTGLLGRTRLAAGAVTGFALFPNRHADVGLGTRHRLLKRDFERIAHVGTAKHLRSAATTAAGTAPEDFREDVTEVAETTLALAEAAETAESARTGCARIDAGLAVAVVGRAFWDRSESSRPRPPA